MRIKEFLNQIRQIDLLIDEKLKDVQMLRDRLTNISVGVNGERVQTSKTDDKFAETMAKIVDLENEINRDIDKLVDYKTYARELIEKLDDNVLKTILYARYFSCATFEEIAVKINYSWRHTCRLHGIALQRLNVIESHIDKVV